MRCIGTIDVQNTYNYKKKKRWEGGVRVWHVHIILLYTSVCT